MSLQHKCKWWTRLANNTFNNARLRVANSLLMRHFSLLMYDLKMNTINVKYVADFL